MMRGVVAGLMFAVIMGCDSGPDCANGVGAPNESAIFLQGSTTLMPTFPFPGKPTEAVYQLQVGQQYTLRYFLSCAGAIVPIKTWFKTAARGSVRCPERPTASSPGGANLCSFAAGMLGDDFVGSFVPQQAGLALIYVDFVDASGTPSASIAVGEAQFQ
jgi:hypothetical protein